MLESHSPARAASERGVQLFRAGEHRQAQLLFEVAAALEPEQATHLVNAGVARQAMGEADAAVALFREALAVDPHHAQAWLNMAHSLHGLRRQDEAEPALLEAAKDPGTMVEALTALGNLRLELLRYREAADAFGQALAAGNPTARLLASRGAALFQAGEARLSREDYAAASAIDPAETGFRSNLDFLTMLCGILDGNADPAIAAFAKPLSDDSVFVGALGRALNFLLAFDHRQAAAQLVAEWLQYYDDDPTAGYFRDVLANRRLTRAPPAFIAAHCDAVAAQFTDTLAAHMHYAVPQTLALMLAENAARGEKPANSVVLDLGCGTGLMATALPRPRHLTGIDLSPNMIGRAAERGIYDNLEVADCIDFLSRHGETFDIVTAADVLVYFGDLSLFFRRAAEALRPKGWFACSVETSPDATSYLLAANGRFRHHPDYVGAVARANGLRPMERRDIVLRQEAAGPVTGSTYLFQRA